MKTQNPGLLARGSALVLKVYVACETFIHLAGLAVKRWTLRWKLTLASDLGLYHSQQAKDLNLIVDRLQTALEEMPHV